MMVNFVNHLFQTHFRRKVQPKFVPNLFPIFRGGGGISLCYKIDSEPFWLPSYRPVYTLFFCSAFYSEKQTYGLHVLLFISAFSKLVSHDCFADRNRASSIWSACRSAVQNPHFSRSSPAALHQSSCKSRACKLALKLLSTYG